MIADTLLSYHVSSISEFYHHFTTDEVCLQPPVCVRVTNFYGLYWIRTNSILTMLNASPLSYLIPNQTRNLA